MPTPHTKRKTIKATMWLVLDNKGKIFNAYHSKIYAIEGGFTKVVKGHVYYSLPITKKKK